MPSERVIEDQTYRLGRLNAKQQFHVARRLAPIIAAIASQQQVTGAALYEAVSKLTDEDCDYVIRLTMSVVHRRVGDAWAATWNTAADQPQFADISAATLLALVSAVIEDNLGSFTRGPAEGGPGQPTITPNARLN